MAVVLTYFPIVCVLISFSLQEETVEECGDDSDLAVITGIEGCAEVGDSSPENDKTDVVPMMDEDFSPTMQVSRAESG